MKTAENDELIDYIGRQNAIINGFTIHSNPTIARDNFRRAMRQYAQERTKDMYPKEFVEWCIESTAKCHPKGQYVEIEGNKEFKTLDELFIYWRDKIK